jgi:hypothetical protein
MVMIVLKEEKNENRRKLRFSDCKTFTVDGVPTGIGNFFQMVSL